MNKSPPKILKYHLSLSQIVQPSNSHGADLQFYSLGGGGKKTMSLKPKWVTPKILSK